MPGYPCCCEPQEEEGNCTVDCPFDLQVTISGAGDQIGGCNTCEEVNASFIVSRPASGVILCNEDSLEWENTCFFDYIEPLTCLYQSFSVQIQLRVGVAWDPVALEWYVEIQIELFIPSTLQLQTVIYNGYWSGRCDNLEMEWTSLDTPCASTEFQSICDMSSLNVSITQAP